MFGTYFAGNCLDLIHEEPNHDKKSDTDSIKNDQATPCRHQTLTDEAQEMASEVARKIDCESPDEINQTYLTPKCKTITTDALERTVESSEEKQALSYSTDSHNVTRDSLNSSVDSHTSSSSSSSSKRKFSDTESECSNSAEKKLRTLKRGASVSPPTPSSSLHSPRREMLPSTTEHARDSYSTHSGAPPNVTVIHPSATHPMFSYMYPHAAGLYSSTAHPLSLPVGHPLFSSGGLPGNGHSLTLPFMHGSPSPGSTSAAGYPLSQEAIHRSFMGMGNPHAMWYAAALSNMQGGLEPHHTLTSGASLSTSHVNGTSPHTINTISGRYPPFSIPPLRTSMTTASVPLPATASPIKIDNSHTPLSVSMDNRLISPTHSFTMATEGTKPAIKEQNSPHRGPNGILSIDRLVNS